MGKNIGFVATRFEGTDGVTLEASKWAEVLQQNGHKCFWFAGVLDRDAERSYLVPEAYFQHKNNQSINSQVFDKKQRTIDATEAIHQQRSLLKFHLHQFVHKFGIDLLIAENVLSIPMHTELKTAQQEYIAECINKFFESNG